LRFFLFSRWKLKVLYFFQAGRLPAGGDQGLMYFKNMPAALGIVFGFYLLFMIAEQSLDCGTSAPLWISVRKCWKSYRLQEAIKTD